MEIVVVPVTMFVQNCMLASHGQGGPAVVVDPGGDIDRVQRAIEERDAHVEGILVTHGHIDHIGGLEELVELTGAPVWYHDDDLYLYQRPGFGRRTPISLPANAVPVTEGDVVEVAGFRFDVLHTPGHSPGSVTYVHEDVAFVGDVLFYGNIGRTDLPGGDFDVLETSIREKLWPLADETNVLPGHGRPTTIGFEKMHNPFVGRFANFP